ncbi:MAG: pstS [Moraxellaceae bacterium]|nr:pstS [Moraxellaceae bacterium]
MNIKGIIAALGLTLGLMGTAQATVDPKLPDYSKASGISGNISSIGSDTLNNLMTLWAEAFKKQYPNVNIQIQGAGSSTAPPALEQGTANFGPMSRAMKENEIQAFEKKHGYKPTAVPVAVDALAIFVHKDNPIKGLSMPVLDAMFSSTRKCGFEKTVKTWGDAGLTGAWVKRDLQIYGRNSVSGTYGYFKEHALCKGDFKTGVNEHVNEQPGSASVVQSVATSINGIGYSGIGYKTSGVRTVPLKGSDGEFYDANEKNALSGKYPLARFLYVYVNKAPNKPLAPLEAEFVKMVLSKQGQQVVEKDGYIPMPASEARKIRAKLGL